MLFRTDHTLTLECYSVLKATKQVNGKGQNSTPLHAKTLIWPILTKLTWATTSWASLSMLKI